MARGNTTDTPKDAYTPPGQGWLHVKEVGRRLRIRPQRLAEFIRKGQLKARQYSEGGPPPGMKGNPNVAAHYWYIRESEWEKLHVLMLSEVLERIGIRGLRAAKQAQGAVRRDGIDKKFGRVVATGPKGVEARRYSLVDVVAMESPVLRALTARGWEGTDPPKPKFAPSPPIVDTTPEPDEAPVPFVRPDPVPEAAMASGAKEESPSRDKLRGVAIAQHDLFQSYLDVGFSRSEALTLLRDASGLILDS